MDHLVVGEIPAPLAPLVELALDLRWTWSHAGDEFWKRVDPEIWERTENPWAVLQAVAPGRLAELAADEGFLEDLRRSLRDRQTELASRTWYELEVPESRLGAVAYFSMEFGLGGGLPLYAGGLGVLAGDYLKAASDLGVPLVGVGLLFQEGYFRQVVDADGRQLETYPTNDPISLPIQPARARDGSWLRVEVQLPGRPLRLRVWRAAVGRVPLFLLDSNDPLNGPADRGITAKLYGGGAETRLLQELALGVGGWAVLELLGFDPEVCHLNEGHAAFAALARAASFMRRHRLSFHEALWATRAGNVFTTHTPVAAGFDLFPGALVERYLRAPVLGEGPAPAEVMALGRGDPGRDEEPINTAFLALRCASRANGVSRLHGEISRQLFRELYPRWPLAEVPVGHVTNGVHVPSWDSPFADRVWTAACGKGRWLGSAEELGYAIQSLGDDELWAFRAEGRQALVRYARDRLAQQLGQRGADPDEIAGARHVLDPNVLTVGFARRFVEYKRPNLLLVDPGRLLGLLGHPARPLQLVVAGKAHPSDEEGRRLVQEWVQFVNRPEVRHRAVFLEDYDMAMAQRLVAGVDLWVNTPRRPWEACGTSGMKVLANGGLNLSELDGWWAEAYAPELGWALPNSRAHVGPEHDASEARDLYRLLEEEVVPAFYERDARGVPPGWVARMRASMARLAPHFSTNRMLQEYLAGCYLPAAEAFRGRSCDGGRLARELEAWRAQVQASWDQVRFGKLEVSREGDRWLFEVQVYAGELPPDLLRVELFADPAGGDPAPERHPMERAEPIAGSANGFLHRARVPASRPASDYTPRARPHHPEVLFPIEEPRVAWQR